MSEEMGFDDLMLDDTHRPLMNALDRCNRIGHY